jgi:hypothetical protein
VWGTGRRVGFFLHSGDFWADDKHLLGQGVNFLETPRREPYGLAASLLTLGAENEICCRQPAKLPIRHEARG